MRRGAHTVDAGMCPADLLPEDTDIIAALHMSLELALQWHRLLYAELRGEHAQ